MKGIRFFFLTGIVSLLFSCAIQVPPAGGTKDTSPPKILKEIPDNYSTSFTGHDISISFDEYIQLKDLNSQLLVSPPLKYAPDAKIRKRILQIHLDDTLLENTTYTLNFGNAIVDNSEGNPLDNFQFVFSTGPVLDSLTISGSVENAFDAKKQKGVFVMLYRETGDSVPFKQRPLYFAKTSEDGTFKIRNTSPGSYKLFALQETNNNYLYESPEEAIAFPDSLIPAPSAGIRLRLFHEHPKLQWLKSFSEEPGKVSLVFSGAIDTIPFRFLTDTSALQIHALVYSGQKDTLTCWYKNLHADSLQLIFNGTSFRDTVAVRLLRNDSKSGLKRKFQLTGVPGISAGGIQDLHRPLEIRFNHPITTADPAKIRLLKDSNEVKNSKWVFADSLHLRLQLFADWEEGAAYSLFIPPGCFTDIYNLTQDTIQLNFRTPKQTDYGSVAVHISSPGNTRSILQLVDEKDVLFREVDFSGDTLITFSNLDPRIYRLKCISDKNRNGRWDTGYYLQGVQPEYVDYYPENLTVRANWDVDIKWTPKGE